MRTRSLVAAALVAAVLSACSTNYVPHTPGRLFVTMDSGKWSYVRDGQRYDHGMLGGGLEDAVRGNPQAEAAAAEYTSRLRTGLLFTILGTLGMVGGLTGAVATAVDEEGNDSRTQQLLGLTVISMAVMFGGAMYAASAEPYRWDAINMFNDQPPPPPPGYGPPGYGTNYDPLRSVTPISSRAAAKRFMSVVPAPSSSNLESRASFSKPSSSM
jgi:hypothetical protein